MYREKASEPLIDTETGATFVAQPFLHFKDTHKFNITLDNKVFGLSCNLSFDSEFRSNAHFFGNIGIVKERAPIYTVHSIRVSSLSGLRIKMNGPERKQAFDDVLPIFGKMLLRFKGYSNFFIAPMFHEDYFKSFDELQMEALRHRVTWAHTYVVQSRMLMKRFNLDTLAEVRAKLRVDPELGDDDYAHEDRIEAAIESFAPDEFFLWLGWAEHTLGTVISEILELLSPKARARNMETFLFADLLQRDVDLPEQEDYVVPRLKELVPELITTEDP
jgi:hypothetical protein